jgi:hypothetical protein
LGIDEKIVNAKSEELVDVGVRRGELESNASEALHEVLACSNTWGYLTRSESPSCSSDDRVESDHLAVGPD